MFGEYTYLFDFVNLQFSNDDPMQGYHRVSDTYPTLRGILNSNVEDSP